MHKIFSTDKETDGSELSLIAITDHCHYFSTAPLNSEGFTNDPRSGEWNILLYSVYFTLQSSAFKSLSWKTIYLYVMLIKAGAKKEKGG